MSEKSGDKPQLVDGISSPQRATSQQPDLDAKNHHFTPAQTRNPSVRVVALAETAPSPSGLKARLAALWQKLRPKTRKQAIAYGATGAGLLAVIIIGFFVMASCRVFVCSDGDGALALQEEVDPTRLRGEGDGRINILLIGVGGEEHIAGDLSDTILLASLDPISKDVAMLSIPRDLYIDIPGYGSERINAAHAYGERDGAPEGGPGLLKETLTEALGVPIHYWARADFTGFKQAVDIVGGVEINVEQTVYDYAYPTPNGGYEIFQVDAGNKYMDGDTALKFARSRHTSSDFDRSKRQQQILVALKSKALSLGTLTNPVKLASLIGTIGNHMKTDLQINEIQKLMKIMGEVRDEQIARVGLDNSPENFLASANIGGAAVLLPRAGDFSQIRAYVRNLFVDGFIKSEAAQIEVLNGTATAGLATDTAELLKNFGYQVVRVADADHNSYERPVIYDYSNGSKPYTLRYLEQRFGVTAERRSPGPGQEGTITIIVGGQYTPQT